MQKKKTKNSSFNKTLMLYFRDISMINKFVNYSIETMRTTGDIRVKKGYNSLLSVYSSSNRCHIYLLRIVTSTQVFDLSSEYSSAIFVLGSRLPFTNLETFPISAEFVYQFILLNKKKNKLPCTEPYITFVTVFVCKPKSVQ